MTKQILITILVLFIILISIFRILNSSFTVSNSSFRMANSNFGAKNSKILKCPKGESDPLSTDQLRELKMLQEFLKKQQKKHRLPSIPIGLPKQIMIASCKHGLSSRLVASIISVESKFKQHAKSSTADYGLMQINEKTLIARGASRGLLLSDPVYNLEHGTGVLAEMQSTYRDTESNWFCRYNVGTANLFETRNKKLLIKCVQYASLVMNEYRSLYEPRISL